MCFIKLFLHASNWDYDHAMIVYTRVAKVCNDQELDTEPKFRPQNKNGKYLKLRMVKIQSQSIWSRQSAALSQEVAQSHTTHVK